MNDNQAYLNNCKHGDQAYNYLNFYIADRNSIDYTVLNVVLFVIKSEVERLKTDGLNKRIDWATIDEKFPQEERLQAILERWATPKNKND